MTDQEYIAQREGKALIWLLNLPRIDNSENKGFTYMTNQISINACPGAQRFGASPMIKLLVSHPDTKKRVRSTGNSLFEAVMDAHRRLWDLGIKTPYPDRPDLPLD